MTTRELELKVAKRLRECAALLEKEESPTTNEIVKSAITGLIGELFIHLSALK